MVELQDVRGEKGTLVMFICNHCPYVKHLQAALGELGRDYQDSGIGIVAISANDIASYPQDAPEHMREFAARNGFTFPYLYDESQGVARAYGALKTPHFYVFDKERRLIYTGRGVDSPRDPSRIKTNDLATALEDHLAGRSPATPVTNPIGCNVKWDGKDAHWMPAEACDLV